MSYIRKTHQTTLFLDTLIDEFGSFRECPASIKHAKTGEYMLCNDQLAKRDGIPIEKYIGLTIHGIKKIVELRESVAEHAIVIDQKISARNIPEARYNQVILAHDKSVIIEEVFKRPVLSRDNQVVAILAYAHNITHHAHPLYLFRLYASHHPIQEAIQYFLRYKNLDSAFEVLPSREELLTLLAMRDASDITSIAQSLGYSIDNAKRYQAQIAEKLKILEPRDVLARLQWHSEETGTEVVG